MKIDNTISNRIHFVIPDKLDLNQLLQNQNGSVELKSTVSFIDTHTGRRKKETRPKELKTEHLKKYIKYCYWLINIMWRRRVFDQVEYGSEHSYVHLSRKNLNQIIPDDSIELVKDLMVKLDVMEINEHYSNIKGNSFAKSYRLTEKYHNSKLKLVPIDDRKIISKINKVKANYIEEFPKHIQYQYDQFERFNFDSETAFKALNEALDNKQISTYHYNLYLYNIKILADKDIYFKWSDTDGRVYHSVSNTPRVVRHNIKDQSGNHMVLIDFSSSLPCHFYKYCWDFKSNANDLDFNQNELEKELNDFKSMLETGNLYMHIVDVLSCKDDINNGYYVDRNTAKELFLKKWLNVREVGETGITKIINNRFPQMTKIKNQLRSEEYKKVYRDLMKSEAELLNKTIVLKFKEELDHPLFYTIHDAILIDQKNAERAKEIMLEEAFNHLGMEIKVKSEIIDENYFTYEDYKIMKFEFDHSTGHTNFMESEYFNEWIKMIESRSVTIKDNDSQVESKPEIPITNNEIDELISVENATEATSTHIRNGLKLLMIKSDRDIGQDRIVENIKQSLSLKEIDQILEYKNVYQKHEYLDNEFIFDFNVDELKLFLKKEIDCSISDFEKLDEMKKQIRSKMRE